MYSLSPLDRYQQDLRSEGFQRDQAQLDAVTLLDELYRRLAVASVYPGFWRRLALKFGMLKPKPQKGLYFWGGVGRGKTYLMDVFFDALPFKKKLRTHFHRFMRSVHHELKTLNEQRDPLEIVAERFAQKYRVICFDEFFVVDITDAMILANLLDGLFRRGVTLVATSNIVPSGLYSSGLQRQRFLPAIALLETHTQVVNVDGGVDYRLRALKQSDLYFTPIDDIAELSLGECFSRLVLSDAHVRANLEIEIEGRTIAAKREAEGVVWFDFYVLCDGPRSQNDYIELAREYHTVFLQNVPCFSEGSDDLARRFIYLVDEFYDRNVKLVISAEAPFMALYASGRLSFEFQRTQSRLQEMQSEAYLASPHKG